MAISFTVTVDGENEAKWLAVFKAYVNWAGINSLSDKRELEISYMFSFIDRNAEWIETFENKKGESEEMDAKVGRRRAELTAHLSTLLTEMGWEIDDIAKLANAPRPKITLSFPD